MNADRNRARVLELIERVTNGHDLGALDEFTSNPAVVASGAGPLARLRGHLSNGAKVANNASFNAD